MNWDNFFKLRPSSLFIALFGLLTGIFGYAYSQLPDKPSERHKLLWYLFGSSTVTVGCLKWVDSTVEKEIEIKTKERTQESLEKEMSKFVNYYSKEMDDLKKELDTLRLPPEQLQKISGIMNRIKLADQQFDSHVKAAKEIAKWLKENKNHSALKQAAMNAVKSQSQSPISEEYLEQFEKDIGESIIWLFHSINHQKNYPFEEERYASAMINVRPIVLAPYITALNSMKKYLQEQQELKKPNKNTNIVEEMIELRISEIGQLFAKIK